MPKLKGGQMKVPPFLSDLYLDLRDRRLLPLVVLILVAIIATPVLLAGSSDESEPAPGPSAGASGATPAAQSLTVVKAEPGLRNYKKRLAHRRATDPFKQRFTAPQDVQAAKLGSAPAPAPSGESSSSAGEESPLDFEASSPAPPVEAGGGGAATGGDSNDHALPDGSTIYTLEVTLQITRIETRPDGSVDKKGPTLYKDVQAPAPLPGEKTPVLTYLGMGSNDQVPMFLVSNEVTGIFGEANCISGAKTCQLLVLEEGFPVTFVYGENDVRYKVNLIKADPIVIDHS
jgi:hypothetical protein